MSLKQKLLDDLEAERNARIAAIEAATDLIEQAETMTAALNSAGMPCSVWGYSSRDWVAEALSGRVGVDISTDGHLAPAAIIGAIIRSGLTIQAIEPYGNTKCGITVRFVGTDVTLKDISTNVGDMLSILPPDPNAAPPTPATETLRMVVNNVIGIAGTITINQADEVPA